MATIRELFDPQKGIDRHINKVISFLENKEEKLKSEVSEYIVTDSIHKQLEDLLMKMDTAIDSGGIHEIGVWISGFYGSGKSSFAKYLSLAFDQSTKVDGLPFLKHFQNRVTKPQAKALLTKLSSRFSAKVIQLDLASDQIPGQAGASVSFILFNKVIQALGYSRILKVSLFERKLKVDGLYDKFTKIIKDRYKQNWADIKNNPLVIDGVLPKIAHELYPDLFNTNQSFSQVENEAVHLMSDSVKEMIEIIREETGKENIIFVIDEVGQYVGSQQAKILDLQGLAENMKNIGQGKVWIFSTAQQTLTEDDPSATLNSPELYKLKDRFPISVFLESSDIKEICYRRLLEKSLNGEKDLGQLFDTNGQALRQNTKLVDSKFYDEQFDRKNFINLYPFLPAHFEILLRLLGALAKSTGGIGLRSAIKVVQDILIGGPLEEVEFLANKKIGCLANTVTLYNALERDIERAFHSLHQSVEKVVLQFPDNILIQDVAKTITVLQILSNIPVNVANIAALMHSSIDQKSLKKSVEDSVDKIKQNQFVSLGENEQGSLKFLSDKLNDVEQERSRIIPRLSDTQNVFNSALNEVFSNLPHATVHGNLSVTTGLKRIDSGRIFSLKGHDATVQTIVSLSPANEYEEAKTLLITESLVRLNENSIFLLGRMPNEAKEQAEEICRCKDIVENHRIDLDQEITEYRNSQINQSKRILEILRGSLNRELTAGSFIFRGTVTAVSNFGDQLLPATNKQLSQIADQIYDHYSEAPYRVETNIAERFLRANNFGDISSELDPGGLVQSIGGSFSIQTEDPALMSIKDYIARHGSVEGRDLNNNFKKNPFGWSPDTIRYLVAALFLSTEIKFKVAGNEITQKGQKAIDAIKSNKSFDRVGVSIRENQPSMEVLAKAAERLTVLSADRVNPDEVAIGKSTRTVLPKLQKRYSNLGEKLSRFNLPGEETMEFISREILDLLETDASEAPIKFGNEQSPLYDALDWAKKITQAFEENLEGIIGTLRNFEKEIANLPDTGHPGNLKNSVSDELKNVSEKLRNKNFFEDVSGLQTIQTTVENKIEVAVSEMIRAQNERLNGAESDFGKIPAWHLITAEEKHTALSKLQQYKVDPNSDINGLRKLINAQTDITNTFEEIKQHIITDSAKKSTPSGAGKKSIKTIKVPPRITSGAELEALVAELKAEKDGLDQYELQITIG